MTRNPRTFTTSRRRHKEGSYQARTTRASSHPFGSQCINTLTFAPLSTKGTKLVEAWPFSDLIRAQQPTPAMCNAKADPVDTLEKRPLMPAFPHPAPSASQKECMSTGTQIARRRSMLLHQTDNTTVAAVETAVAIVAAPNTSSQYPFSMPFTLKEHHQ